MTRQDSLYEKDFYAWTQWHIKALANRAASELDWENLRRELECLGRQEYRELVSRLTVLIGHLLKWELQPEHRCRSWFLTIREQRRAIERHLKRSPSLHSLQKDALADGFEGGVDLALRQTSLPLRVFPEKCPYTFEQVLDKHFFCDTSTDWK